MSRLDDTIAAKKVKREELTKKGILVHPYSYAKKQSIAQALDMMGQEVTTAGRIRSVRSHGKVHFLDVSDSTAAMQVMVRVGEIPDQKAELIPFIDAGDFLGVTGTVVTTKTGEVTIQANDIEFLGKSLRPLPTEWNAAEDKEVRFKKRYVDMLVNPDTKRILDARWTIEKELRRYLQDEHNFVEVETPILQPLYGGTNAKPFTTHMNALDRDFYLRVAPELYLKRFIVGGYERVFEIARNFRNEGIDQTHQPEFTMVEWYEAYADYHRMMDVTEGLLKHLATKLYGDLRIKVGELEIDLGGKWPRITMKEALLKYAQVDFDTLSDDQVHQLYDQHQIQKAGVYSRGRALFELFDKLVTHQLIQPIWIIDYPKEVSPLAKTHRDNPDMVERFEAYIGGKEIADGWSEITDAIDQRQRFENEQKNMRAGDTEAHPVDEEFLEAMEYGMPPLGGIGIGIDRLVMFLTNTWSIREVIAFPTLRKDLGVTAATHQPTPTAPVGQRYAQPVESPSVSHPLPPREQAEQLLTEHIQDENLRHHCQMVAQAMAAYAQKLSQDVELWYQTGLLHDLDWEEFPDEHPNKAIAEWLSEYPAELRNAVAAHAPERTGKKPETMLERYLFACDEISGFMNAVSLMRPNGFADMEAKSIKKKLKDKAFAANVSRDDIMEGMRLIETQPDDHINFLISVFK